MACNELAIAIRAGPKELSLSDNIFFRRRSLSNPPIFNDFLQALRENSTIEKVVWRPRFSNNLSPDQRLSAYQAIGEMQSLKELDIAAPLTEASPIGIACQAPNLESVKINTTMSLRYDVSAQAGLVATLRAHKNLQDFQCLFASHTVDSLDPLLLALTSCPIQRVHITTTHPVSGEAVAALLATSTLRDLHVATVLPRDLSWDFPRLPECNWKDLCSELANSKVERLRLVAAAEREVMDVHMEEMAAAIGANTHLQDLSLECTSGFSDVACEALAASLAAHPNLQHVTIAGQDWRGSTFALQSPKSYQAFSKMLRHQTTGMQMTIGQPVDENICKDHRLYYRDMVVQMMLHQVGRHDLILTTDQSTWVQSMTRINALDLADNGHSWAIQDSSDWELFKLECIMWMVKENPLVTKRIKERRKESLDMVMAARRRQEKEMRQALLRKAKISTLTKPTFFL